MPTATSSTLEAARGYCRPAFLLYPNMPTANTNLNFSHNDLSIFYRQSDFFLNSAISRLTERFSGDNYMTDLHTINDIRNFHPLPFSVQAALQCHLGLVPVAEEWQQDNNKQPCISMWQKEKTNPFQFFTHWTCTYWQSTNLFDVEKGMYRVKWLVSFCSSSSSGWGFVDSSTEFIGGRKWSYSKTKQDATMGILGISFCALVTTT